MIFSKDEKDEQAIASIPNGDRAETYACSFRACENPACTCGALTVDFTPEQNQSGASGQLSSHTVEIDVDKKRLGARSKKEPSKEDRTFAKLIFSRLDEDDFDFLARRHYEYKNRCPAFTACCSSGIGSSRRFTPTAKKGILKPKRRPHCRRSAETTPAPAEAAKSTKSAAWENDHCSRVFPQIRKFPTIETPLFVEIVERSGLFHGESVHLWYCPWQQDFI